MGGGAAPGGPGLAVQILLGTGMRVGELAELTLDDYESDGDVGFLKVRKGKGAKFRRVPLSSRLRREIDRYLNRFRQDVETNRLLVKGNGQPAPIITLQYLLMRMHDRLASKLPAP